MRARNTDTALEFITSEEIAPAKKFPEGSSLKALFVSIALKSDPAWDEKGSGVGRREKIISSGVEKNIHMAASVLLKLISAQRHNSCLPAEPTT